MSYDDMTDAELDAKAYELRDDIQGITEQIDGIYQLQLNATADTKDWLFRAFSARRYRRAELREIQQELSRRQPQGAPGSKSVRRAQHIGQLTNACFVRAACESLTPEMYQQLMRQAKAMASAKVDENGSPVKAA